MIGDKLQSCLGKRFIFAIIMGVCVTITSIVLKYDGEIYWKLVGTITAIFTISQSLTDRNKNTDDKRN